MHLSCWRWALVERRWRGHHVLRTGEVAEGDWNAIRDSAGTVGAVGIALPDRSVVLRRLRVGHPPRSRDALQRLLRWRLREDLPFDAKGTVLDAQVEGDHVITIAADVEQVRAAEEQAKACGPVERVQPLSIAAFNVVARDLGPNAEVLVVHDGGYAEIRMRAGTVEHILLRDGSPATEDAGRRLLDLRSGADAAAAAIGAAL